MNSKNIFDELQTSGMSTSAINQYIKCKEKGLVVSRDTEDIELLRNFLSICKKHNFNFDYDQQQIIYNGLSVGLSVEQVSKYADPDYRPYTMRQLFAAFVKGVDISKWVPKVGTKFWMLEHLRILATKGFSDEKILLYINSLNTYSNENEFYEFRFCIECGMPDNEIKKMQGWNASKVRQARLKYLKKQNQK